MSNAARRVLELFLQAPIQGVTGVTHVTERLVMPKNPAVTPVTPVTCQKRYSGNQCATSATAAPDKFPIELGERAAVIEYDGGAPRTWAEALAQLDPARPPCDIPPARWLRFIDDCGRFIDDGWAPCAEALGWTSLDLFGCNRAKPFSRINHAGLLWLLNGRKLLALGPNAATIATASGGKLTFRKCANEPGRVLAWELSRQEDAQ
jgi:hypothetical protein